MPSQFKRFFNLGLKILIAAGLILFLIRSGHLDLKLVWELMTPQNITLGLVLVGINTILAVWRWLLLLKARGIELGFFHGFSLYLIGMFFNYALPGAVSGDLVRGYYLVQDFPNRRMDSVLSVLIDRVLGLYSFFILTLLAAAWDFEFVLSHDKLRLLTWICLVIFLGLTGIFVLSFSKPLYRLTGARIVVEKIPPLHKVMEGVQRFGQRPGILAISVLSSVFAQVFTLVFFYAIGRSLNEPGLTWAAVFFAVPMGFVVTAVPIAPAGVGVGQVAFLYLFQTYLGHNTQLGAIAITAFQLALAVYAIIGAGFYLRRRKPHELDNLEIKMEAAAT